jgi:hypothetical protein
LLGPDIAFNRFGYGVEQVMDQPLLRARERATLRTDESRGPMRWSGDVSAWSAEALGGTRRQGKPELGPA